MQAALNLPTLPPIRLITPAKSQGFPCCWSSIPKLQSSRTPQLKVTVASNDSPTVDYSSVTSVFPAEACETIGGDTCDAKMYPEVKLTPQPKNTASTDSSEPADREYLEYNGPKTVFPGEACDDLGGEFCEPEYQTGVY
ncbi:hypothetical protein L484_013149 [Morus notabilis]|uniref:Light-regulated protein n=1 Tax=Morus notabilis TaxID=981085 RepID=W9RBM4_9ROSA|nr:light-regulated protein, chloroplastic [Morus notabilis]EXB81208.1 hypothetical protein L484_013149 [Morus notabilis]